MVWCAQPENVLVSVDGQLKLGDFGQAQLKSGWRDGGEGDATYMAPELFQNAEDASPTFAADVFSLGLLLFELATGLVLPKDGPLWHQLREGGAKQLFQRAFDASRPGGRLTPAPFAPATAAAPSSASSAAPSTSSGSASTGSAATAPSSGSITPRVPGASFPSPFSQSRTLTPTNRTTSPAPLPSPRSPRRPYSPASSNSPLSPTLENLILEMLDPNPALRPSADQILARVPRSMVSSTPTAAATNNTASAASVASASAATPQVPSHT